MFSRQPGDEAEPGEMFGLGQNKDCVSAIPDHGGEHRFIEVRERKFLDADATPFCFAPELPHARVGRISAETGDVGHRWRHIQEEIELLSVQIRSDINRDARDVAVRPCQVLYEALLDGLRAETTIGMELLIPRSRRAQSRELVTITSGES